MVTSTKEDSELKRLMAAMAVAGLAALGAGVTHAAADSYSASSSSSGSVDGNGACASTSLQVQQNGSDVVNQSAGQCAP
jgi:hypothetical protein